MNQRLPKQKFPIETAIDEIQIIHIVPQKLNSEAENVCIFGILQLKIMKPYFRFLANQTVLANLQTCLCDRLFKQLVRTIIGYKNKAKIQ